VLAAYMCRNAMVRYMLQAFPTFAPFLLKQVQSCNCSVSWRFLLSHSLSCVQVTASCEVVLFQSASPRPESAGLLVPTVSANCKCAVHAVSHLLLRLLWLLCVLRRV
jgi:hypothetical protein